MLSHVLAGHLTHPYPGGAPVMVAVHDDRTPQLAALRTPGHPVLVVDDPALHEAGAVLDALVAPGRRARRS